MTKRRILHTVQHWSMENTSRVNQQTADPDDQVFVYPNPVKENLSIGGLTKGETVRLYNMNGVLVKEVNTIDNSLNMSVSGSELRFISAEDRKQSDKNK